MLLWNPYNFKLHRSPLVAYGYLVVVCILISQSHVALFLWPLGGILPHWELTALSTLPQRFAYRITLPLIPEHNMKPIRPDSGKILRSKLSGSFCCLGKVLRGSRSQEYIIPKACPLPSWLGNISLFSELVPIEDGLKLGVIYHIGTVVSRKTGGDLWIGPMSSIINLTSSPLLTVGHCSSNMPHFAHYLFPTTASDNHHPFAGTPHHDHSRAMAATGNNTLRAGVVSHFPLAKIHPSASIIDSRHNPRSGRDPLVLHVKRAGKRHKNAIWSISCSGSQALSV